MSVIVGEQPQDTAPKGSGPMRILFVLITVSAAVVLARAGPTSTTPEAQGEIQPPVSTPQLPQEWIASGSITARFITPARAGDALMIHTGLDVILLSADGSTRRPELPGMRQFRGVATADDMVVAYGRSDSGPALWITTDVHLPWQRIDMPWDGSVQGVSLVDRRIVVLATVGSEWMQTTAAWPPPDDSEWSLTQINPPGPVVYLVAGGFISRSLDWDEWLHSTDGSRWVSFADSALHPSGEVAGVVHGATGLEIRLAGDPRIVTPPEWPVSALWRINGRIWIQTPSAAWWSRDGQRWNELPFDTESGYPGGLPVLLPFSDRAIIALNGDQFGRRDLFTWHVGD